jgi:hypothetical protein
MIPRFWPEVEMKLAGRESRLQELRAWLRSRATSEKVLSKRVRLSERLRRIHPRSRISRSHQRDGTSRLPKPCSRASEAQRVHGWAAAREIVWRLWKQTAISPFREPLTRLVSVLIEELHSNWERASTSFGKLDPSSGTLIIAAAPRPGRRAPRRVPVTQPLTR